MTQSDVIPVVLVLLFASVTISGVGVFWLATWCKRRADNVLKSAPNGAIAEGSSQYQSQHIHCLRRPYAWIAIRKRTIAEVQNALSLDGVRPAAWDEDPDDGRTVFIMPPVKGWTFVFGKGLPDPSDDVDACYRFLTGLSRKLGQVQFFSADSVVHHHAWARLEAGRVVRAYAWAGATLWNQGLKTPAETELGLKCFDYGDNTAGPWLGVSDLLAANVEKVPFLAGRWSIDPADIDEQTFAHAHGIAGRPSLRY